MVSEFTKDEVRALRKYARRRFPYITRVLGTLQLENANGAVVLLALANLEIALQAEDPRRQTAKRPEPSPPKPTIPKSHEEEKA
jgi:hypothetical protein